MGAAAASAQPPGALAPQSPPAANTPGVATPGVATPGVATSGPPRAAATSGVATPSAGAPGVGTPDDAFIEFLGADDDAVRWELKNSAQRTGRAPVPPPQDATQ